MEYHYFGNYEQVEGEVSVEQKAVLDDLHLRKIRLADVCVVINVGGYMGDSTKHEIAFAVRMGKPVLFMELDDPQRTTRSIDMIDSMIAFS